MNSQLLLTKRVGWSSSEVSTEGVSFEFSSFVPERDALDVLEGEGFRYRPRKIYIYKTLIRFAHAILGHPPWSYSQFTEGA